MNKCRSARIFFTSTSYYGPGNGPVHIYNLGCQGDETSLEECRYFREGSCADSNAGVAVVCYGELILLCLYNHNIYRPFIVIVLTVSRSSVFCHMLICAVGTTCFTFQYIYRLQYVLLSLVIRTKTKITSLPISNFILICSVN